MENEIIVTFESHYVHAVANGDRDFDFVKRLWTTIHDTCLEHDCHNVLGESFTTRPASTLDVMKAPDLVTQLEMNTGYRMAWVEHNPDAVDTFNFIENVLSNQGIYVRIFDNVESAREWLLDSN